jgi:YVTN family beta-propeller protein
MELTADGKELWVTARWRRMVSIVDTQAKKVTREIPVGKSPHGVFFIDHAKR